MEYWNFVLYRCIECRQKSPKYVEMLTLLAKSLGIKAKVSQALIQKQVNLRQERCFLKDCWKNYISNVKNTTIIGPKTRTLRRVWRTSASEMNLRWVICRILSEFSILLKDLVFFTIFVHIIPNSLKLWLSIIIIACFV